MTAERLSKWAEWPQSYYLPREDAILVSGRYERPGMFRLWGTVYLLGGVWALMALSGGPVNLFTLFLYMATQIEGAWTPADNPRGWLCLALIVALIALYRPLWQRLIIRLFGGNVWVRIDRENVTVKSAGKKFVIARGDVWEIAKERHHKAKAEEKQKGPFKPGDMPVWQDAIEVVLRSGEARLPVAEMIWKDELRADALVLRLQQMVKGVDSLLDGMALATRIPKMQDLIRPADDAEDEYR